jgi:hypothetical protein
MPAAPMATVASPGKAKQDSGGKPGKTGDVTSWKRSAISANASRLMVGDSEQLPLRGVEARVVIDGFRARVVLDYHYENDKGRQLEGTFQLRLPEEASPYLFAFGQSVSEAPAPQKPPSFFSFATAREMPAEATAAVQARKELWAAPKEARMVQREKAAFAYGETVRARVDPALVEWQGAGIFSARVFPLAPSRMHRIVFGYDADLATLGDDLEYALSLPEGVPSSVTVSVRTLETGSTSTTPAARPLQASGYAHYRFDNPDKGQVTVRLKQPGASLLTGEDSASPYFAVRLRPALPTLKSSAEARGVFLIDTSLSSNPDRFNVWLKLLRAIADNNRPEMKQIAVLFFNVEARWYRPAFIDNTPENIDALIAHAESLSLEGATDLGAALAQAASPPWKAPADRARHDVFLLSDGASTWGESDPHALSRKLAGGAASSLFAYATGMAGTDGATLAHLTREAGGALFSVAGEAEVTEASRAHTRRPFRLKEIQVKGGADLMLAGRPRSLFPGQQLTLVGRGSPDPKAPAVLVLEQGGKEHRVSVSLGHRIESSLAPRLYGTVATGQLEELSPTSDPEAERYARHFRITGKTCSLLMLESEADYVRFGIKPEADDAEVRGSRATELFATAMKHASEVLGDPRAAFLALLDRLEKSPGVAFKGQQIRGLIEPLPVAAFDVPSPALTCKHPTREGVPGALLEALSTHTLTYDPVEAEAARRLAAQGPADALTALSSLVEENPGDAVLARDVGYAAMTWGLGGQAYHLFRRVAQARPFEPLNYQAMGKSLASQGKLELAMLYYEIVLAGTWDERFGDLAAIVEVDYLRVLRRVASSEPRSPLQAQAAARLEGILAHSDVGKSDLVVMIAWNTDNTDVDLHVTEPSEEECFYGHRTTKSGGKLTRDVTRGYGPEMYTLPTAPSGKYQVRAKYFASDANRTSARTKVYSTVIRRFGKPGEEITEKVVALAYGKDMHDIDVVQF